MDRHRTYRRALRKPAPPACFPAAPSDLRPPANANAPGSRRAARTIRRAGVPACDPAKPSDPAAGTISRTIRPALKLLLTASSTTASRSSSATPADHRFGPCASSSYNSNPPSASLRAAYDSVGKPQETTALQDAGVRPSQLDRVLLVGGSTRIPRVAAVLTERLGQEPHGEVDPDLCVALVAGVQVGIEMGQGMQAVLVDITPYTFGTSASGELYGMPYAHQFFPLIRRNSKLPAIRTDVFFTMFPDQEEWRSRSIRGRIRTP